MGYIIGKGCSTCHYCYNECPVHAIGFVDSDYAIDMDKCTECGRCAEVCPSGIIRDTNASIPKKHEPGYLSADLVVIGGGGSGLVAATKFAQKTGKRVIVLEKGPRVGGNTTLAHGFIKSAKWTRYHREAGVPDEREKFVGNLMRTSKGKLDETLIRDAQYALCDMVEFLFDFGGYEDLFCLSKMEFGPDAGSYMVDFPNRWKHNLKSTDHSMGPGWQTTYAIETLEAAASGLGVEILREHRAVKLLTGDRGEITGVIADDPGGQTTIETRCIIIATGGFSRNEELMKKLRPTFFEDYPVHSFSFASNTGDGIELVQDIGGATDWDNVRMPMFGPTHHPFHYGVVRMIEQPEILRVDKTGRRFQNEAEFNMSFMGVMEELPGHMGWAIMDSNTAAIMGDRLIAAARDEATRYGFKSWKEQLEEETTYNRATKKADTLEELAERMGADPNVFVEQIARYNEFCAAGIDDDFGKRSEALVPINKPPYYAAFIARFNENTMGGVCNNSDLNAVREDGTPIEGLYVAGDVCRGLVVVDSYMDKFGDCAWAMGSGYLCAEKAAEYLSE